MRTSGSLGADQHQLAGVGWMAGGVSQRDHAAKRHAQDYRTGDAQDIAERAHVIAPLRQIPAFPGTVLASTIASMIQIDDLNDISQGRVCRLVDRVVEAGPAMKQQQCRLFSHHGTVRHQLRALNVEEKPHPIDEHLHGVTPWIRDRSGQPSRLRVWYGYRTLAMKRADWALVTFLAHSISQCVPLSMSRRFCRQARMSSRFHGITGAAAMAAMLALGSQALAQSDDADAEMRIQQLENQLRQLTGQNEELQYRNRQLEERLRLLQGGAQAAPGGQPVVGQPNIAAVPPMQPNPGYRPPQPQPGYDQQIAAPAPIVQDPQAASPGAPQGRRRGDAFDPSQSPNAPGVPQALGGGQLPLPAGSPVGAPGGRGAGDPLDLANTGGARNPPGGLPPPPARNPGASAALTTLPPSATPRDEFDLGIGYMQRKDYALAEETMRNFVQKYPSDPLVADSQYWLGESFFQRQQYRDAAEAFLGVTTKFDKSAKAPDALLRLGQSLAALKEKEAACAALGEVTRKYPRASSGVKQAVDREQKRVKC